MKRRQFLLLAFEHRANAEKMTAKRAGSGRELRDGSLLKVQKSTIEARANREKNTIEQRANREKAAHPLWTAPLFVLKFVEPLREWTRWISSRLLIEAITFPAVIGTANFLNNCLNDIGIY